MCGPIFAFWAGRHNNGAIVEGPRGGNVNTRVVKLQPLNERRGEENNGSVKEGNGDIAVKGNGPETGRTEGV